MGSSFSYNYKYEDRVAILFKLYDFQPLGWVPHGFGYSF